MEPHICFIKPNLKLAEGLLSKVKPLDRDSRGRVPLPGGTRKEQVTLVWHNHFQRWNWKWAGVSSMSISVQSSSSQSSPIHLFSSKARVVRLISKETDICPNGCMILRWTLIIPHFTIFCNSKNNYIYKKLIPSYILSKQLTLSLSFTGKF